MPLIYSKIHSELSWRNDCVMSNIPGATTFKITSSKYVPIVTLSTKDNVNLTKQLHERFKRSVYWNEYKPSMETKQGNDQTLTRFPLDASFQGVNRLFGLAFYNTGNSPNRVQRYLYRNIFFQE